MNTMRAFFLWASQNSSLREALPRYRFIQHAVKRFMPGETLEDALRAAEVLKDQNLSTVVTQLGENLTFEKEAEQVTQHYLDVLENIERSGLDSYISVKLTQLGLDLDEGLCFQNLDSIVARAETLKKPIFVDMEGSAYVDRTISVYRRTREKHPNVGLCLQAYLYRTPADVRRLLAEGCTLRLVKGTYRESPQIAFKAKKKVDEQYFTLARRILKEKRQEGIKPAIATHDPILIDRIKNELAIRGVAKDDFEFQMLYGIQRDLQMRLAREGYRVRVLISYGSFWFPWYMRRLAERPANVWFVLKNIFVR